MPRPGYAGENSRYICTRRRYTGEIFGYIGEKSGYIGDSFGYIGEIARYICTRFWYTGDKSRYICTRFEYTGDFFGYIGDNFRYIGDFSGYTGDRRNFPQQKAPAEGVICRGSQMQRRCATVYFWLLSSFRELRNSTSTRLLISRPSGSLLSPKSFSSIVPSSRIFLSVYGLSGP